MNKARIHHCLRLTGVLAALAVAGSSFGQEALAYGTISATTLDFTFPEAFTSSMSNTPVTTYDFGPGAHYSTALGPTLSGNPSVLLYSATNASAEGTSTAGADSTSIMSWFVTNTTQFFETAELTYSVDMASQSLLFDPVNQGAFNIDDIYSYDSISGSTNLLSSLKSSTISSNNDYESTTVSANLFFVLSPFSSATIQFQELSSSYATSAITPEPAPMVALGLGVGVIGLRRRRRQR